jgi:hypothetical protein
MKAILSDARCATSYGEILLQHRAASSFVDVDVVDGVLLDTYQEVAARSGLFLDDNEAEYAMLEAIHTLKTP